MPRRKRWIRWALIAMVVVAAGLGTAALSGLERAGLEVDRDTVWFGEVEQGPMLIEVRAPGRLVPSEVQWIAAPADGTVESLNIEVGDRVQGGGALLRLTNPDLVQAEMEAGLNARSERATVTLESNRLHGEILDLEAGLARLEADWREAELRLAADESLAEDGLVSSLDTEVRRLRAAELSRRVELENRRLAAKRDALPSALDALEARVEQAEALLQFRRRELTSLAVVAEAGGVVTDLDVEPGTRVVRGAPLARVIDPERLMAELDVPQVRARDIAIGQRAVIDLRGGSFTGRVVRIDPSVEEGIVHVDVAPDGPLPAGSRTALRVDARIELERLEDVVYVRRPARAQPNTSIELFRMVGASDVAERIPVEVGETSARTIQILSGLAPGERVILSDTSDWFNVQRVRLR